MDDLYSLARVMDTILKAGSWRTAEARAILRAGRALSREKGCPGLFDRLLAEQSPVQPTAA